MDEQYVSNDEARELQDILCTLTPSGTALKTSARELVSICEDARELLDLVKKYGFSSVNDAVDRALAAEKQVKDLQASLIVKEQIVSATLIANEDLQKVIKKLEEELAHGRDRGFL